MTLTPDDERSIINICRAFYEHGGSVRFNFDKDNSTMRGNRYVACDAKIGHGYAQLLIPRFGVTKDSAKLMAEHCQKEST
jgi:hypothetical protein